MLLLSKWFDSGKTCDLVSRTLTIWPICIIYEKNQNNKIKALCFFIFIERHHFWILWLFFINKQINLRAVEMGYIIWIRLGLNCSGPIREVQLAILDAGHGSRQYYDLNNIITECHVISCTHLCDLKYSPCP